MADVIELPALRKSSQPKMYSLDVTQFPDNIMFTVNDVRADADSLRQIADELEKIAHIIRTDVITGMV